MAGRFYDEAGATFVTLIDIEHRVTELYGMVNVPTGIWIDEHGDLVRPPETAYSREITFGTLTVGDDRYVPALRDWVAKGEESEFALSPEKLRERLLPADPKRLAADAHFRLALHFHPRGDAKTAKQHWSEAQRLAPKNWNYHRQDWAFDAAEARQSSWLRKFEALEGRPYYEPLRLP